MTLADTEKKLRLADQKLQQTEKELRHAYGNVRALSVVIGLMADNYPVRYASQYIHECVEFGLPGDLLKRESSALRYLSQVMDGKTYEKMAEMLSEPEKLEEEQTFEMPDTSQAKRKPSRATVEVSDRAPEISGGAEASAAGDSDGGAEASAAGDSDGSAEPVAVDDSNGGTEDAAAGDSNSGTATNDAKVDGAKAKGSKTAARGAAEKGEQAADEQ